MSDTQIGNLYLESVRYRFKALKELGEKAMDQLSDADLQWSPSMEANSVAVLVQHLRGNMLSRWTDFLTSDGEKSTRQRDQEFEPDSATSRETVMQQWNEGWNALFNAVNPLQPDDLLKSITIRGQEIGVIDAIQRQLSHYAYHVGQLVLLARLRKGADWKSLSIPRGKSETYHPKKRD